MSKDQIYADHLNAVHDFKFDEKVAAVFPDMIARSVPGYHLIMENIALLADKQLSNGGLVYDLGCSLGSNSLAIAQHLQARAGVKIIGLDNSAAMLARAKENIAAYKHVIDIDLQLADITAYTLQACDLVILNFTMQFIDPDKRYKLLSDIYAALKPGGALILSEKYGGANEQIDNELVYLYHSFKQRNGYSQLEISQKRTALENVMRVESLAVHDQRLNEIGFTDINRWFTCFNFFSLVAHKPG